MLDETKPDVLHVCSPHGLHVAHAIEAVKRGINVIIEKPMATAEADAEALIAAAKDAGVHAAVCLTKRSYPMVAELRARILAGELGEVNAISGGFLSWDSNHDDWGWGFDPKIAGTSYATADLGVHWLDLAEHVTDRRITEVDARFSTLRPIRYRNGRTDQCRSRGLRADLPGIHRRRGRFRDVLRVSQPASRMAARSTSTAPTAASIGRSIGPTKSSIAGLTDRW